MPKATIIGEAAQAMASMRTAQRVLDRSTSLIIGKLSKAEPELSVRLAASGVSGAIDRVLKALRSGHTPLLEGRQARAALPKLYELHAGLVAARSSAQPLEAAALLVPELRAVRYALPGSALLRVEIDPRAGLRFTDRARTWLRAH